MGIENEAPKNLNDKISQGNLELKDLKDIINKRDSKEIQILKKSFEKITEDQKVKLVNSLKESLKGKFDRSDVSKTYAVQIIGKLSGKNDLKLDGSWGQETEQAFKDVFGDKTAKDKGIGKKGKKLDINYSKITATKKVAPKEGEVTSAPKEGEVTSVPKEGEVTSVPKEGEVTSVPKEGEVTSAPKEGEVTSAPKEGEVTSVPKEGEVGTIKNLLEQKIPLTEVNYSSIIDTNSDGTISINSSKIKGKLEFGDITPDIIPVAEKNGITFSNGENKYKINGKDFKNLYIQHKTNIINGSFKDNYLQAGIDQDKIQKVS